MNKSDVLTANIGYFVFMEIIQKFPIVKNISLTFKLPGKGVFQLSDEVLQIASEKNIECAVYA